MRSLVFTSFLLSLIMLAGLTSCQATVKSDVEYSITLDSNYVFPYALNHPDTVFKLKNDLIEISGLTNTHISDSLLLAVQDEDGIVFFLNKKTGKIIDKRKFRKIGDYEGIEAVGKDLFVLKSNGTIYQIVDYANGMDSVLVHKTFLTKMSNSEGLGYLPEHNALLVACKGQKNIEKRYLKQIFLFPLDSAKLDSIPFLTINLNKIRSYIEQDPKIKHLEKIQDAFRPDEGGFTFAPAGIAVHPISKNIYVLSSVGKMLIVFDSSGSILHIDKFKKKVHPQPEGLCFDKDGTLWISNEGKDKKATLLKFNISL